MKSCVQVLLFVLDGINALSLLTGMKFSDLKIHSQESETFVKWFFL